MISSEPDEAGASSPAGSFQCHLDNETLRSIADQLLDVIFATDREGQVTYVSASAARIFGWSPQELTGRPFASLLPDGEQPKALNALQSAIRSGQSTPHLTLLIRRKDSTTLRVEVSVSPILKDGVIVGAAGIIRDITHRRETALMAERARLSLALDASHAGTWEWDLRTNQNFWSEELWKVYALEPHSCTPSYEAWRQIVHPADRQFAERVVQTAAAQSTELSLEFRILDSQGGIRWLLSRGRPLHDANGFATRYIGIVIDITERKLAEEALRQSQARLDAALAGMSDAVLISDAQGRFLEFNDAFATFHRFATKAEMATTLADYPAILDVLLPDGTLAPMEMWAVPRALRGESATNAEYTIRRKDTGATWIGSYSFAPIRDQDGSIVGSAVTARDVTEYKRAQAALRESEERWKYALEGAGDGVWDWDAKTNQVHFSRQWKAMLGYAEDEIGDTLSEWDLRIHPDDREGAYAALNAHLRGETPAYRSEHRVKCKDGAWRWILDRGKVITRDANGEPLRVIGTHSDITERKLAEDALRQSERRLAFALETNATGEWDLDLVTHEVHRSLLHARIFGYPSLQQQWSRDIFLQHVLPEDREETGRTIREAVRRGDGWNFECRIRRADGEVRWIWVAARLRPDSEGQPRHVAGVVQDITDRKRAAEALRESEERRRAILQTAMDGFWMADPSGRLLEVNDTCCRMSGYTASELLAMRIQDLVVGDASDSTAVRIQKILDQGEDRFESRHRRKDGSLFDVEISAQFRKGDGGRLVVFLRDITGRKLAEQENAQLQAQFHQAQKMESVGRLAGGVAHDFNNLLTIINGYSGLLLNELKEADPLRDGLDEIGRAGARAAALTRQLLAFSRKQILQPRPVDLNRVVQDLRPMLNRLLGEDVELRVSLDASIGTVHADPHQLEQVLMNLVVNARDAMPDIGVLTIETAGVERDENYARTHPDARVGRYAMLAVIDSGAGMDEETKSHIFEPFFTTKGVGKGTGLGLSMVQGIVAQSGGHIEVSSQPGRGTTFRIYLPALDGQEASPSTPAPAAALGGHETLLVVEDQPEVRKYAVAVLQAKGYRVISANHAAEALLSCERDPIDLVLTDVIMPNMSGRELVDQLRNRRPGIQVLFMSGYTGNIIEHHGVLDQLENFIQKPFSAEDLAAKVRSVLDRALTSPPSADKFRRKP